MDPIFSTFHAIARTDVGKVRHRNEDAVLLLPEAGLLAVSDGMGGASAGDVASRWVVESVQDAFSEDAVSPQGLRRYALQQGILAANQKILGYARHQGYRSMGATLAACLLNPAQPAQVTLCTLGDSRIYLCRSGKLTLLTRDHNVKNEFAQQCAVKPEMARLLTRAVGIHNEPLPQWYDVALQPCDRLLLCTDGVSGPLSDERLSQLLTRQAPLEEVADGVMAAVLETPARDNASLILLDVPEVFPPAITFPLDLCEEAKILESLLEKV